MDRTQEDVTRLERIVFELTQVVVAVKLIFNDSLCCSCIYLKHQSIYFLVIFCSHVYPLGLFTPLKLGAGQVSCPWVPTGRPQTFILYCPGSLIGLLTECVSSLGKRAAAERSAGGSDGRLRSASGAGQAEEHVHRPGAAAPQVGRWVTSVWTGRNADHKRPNRCPVFKRYLFTFSLPLMSVV